MLLEYVVTLLYDVRYCLEAVSVTTCQSNVLHLYAFNSFAIGSQPSHLSLSLHLSPGEEHAPGDLVMFIFAF